MGVQAPAGARLAARRALAGLLAAALYASFASFGYRLFLSGERMQFSAGRVGMLLLGVVWFVPVLLALLGLVERRLRVYGGTRRTVRPRPATGFRMALGRSAGLSGGRGGQLLAGRLSRWTPFFSSIRRWGCGLSTTGIP